MREIKFKVWDNIEKQMVDVKEVCFDDNDNIHGADVWQPDGEDLYPVEFKNNEAVLLQYTGLKDKNGREIYEGDIVERVVNYWDNIFEPDNFEEITEIGYVKYIENNCGFMVIDEKNETMYELERDFEVIGNIYENKELLNEKTN